MSEIGRVGLLPIDTDKIAAAETDRSKAAGLSHPKYRPDIDGLRAVAVTSVVAYHAFPGLLPGGFIGVDIFFVISGYLISSILLENLEKGSYSFLQFYERRILRIFPALFVVLLACLGFGWFTLLASEYMELGKHVVAGAGFVSNLLLWRETGYFDAAAASKPLLHLWSLGIEEQFYIFWPLLLYLIWKARVPALLAILGMWVASFAFSVHETRVDLAAAFYSPFSRFWELLVGGILAQITLNARERLSFGDASKRFKDVQSCIGGTLILLAVLFLDADKAFPGVWALLPTLGCALLIGSGSRAFLNRTLLSSKIAVAIGLISYPMYLWHWPLLSFAHIVQGGQPDPWIRALAAVASVGLAAVTYRTVEKPLRFGTHKILAAAGLLAAMIGVAVLGYQIIRHDGFADRAMARNSKETQIYQDDVKVRRAYDSALQSCRDDPRITGRAVAVCKHTVVPDAKGTMVLWGDSHADAWAPLFQQIATELQYEFILFASTGCPPLLQTRRSDITLREANCTSLGFGEDVVESIVHIHPTDMVVAGRWSMYANGWYQNGALRQPTHFLTTSATGDATLATSREALQQAFRPTIDRLRAATRGTVVIVKSPPALHLSIGEGLLRRPNSFVPTAQENADFEQFSDSLISEVADLPQVRVFDPARQLCAPACSAFFHDVPMYTDDNHVSAQGALLFHDVVLPLFN